MSAFTPSMLPLVIPALIGILLPYVTVLITNQKLQSVVNLALSTLVGVVTTVVVDATTWADFNWPNYVVAVLVAWVLTGRSHQTEFPQNLHGRHEDIDNTHRAREQDDLGGGLTGRTP